MQREVFDLLTYDKHRFDEGIDIRSDYERVCTRFCARENNATRRG